MAKILIVDDSSTQQATLVGIVTAAGHEAVTADNGLEGVEKARELKPDLILMDVVMPELNGFQATRKISRDEELAHIPIVMVTTKDQTSDEVWGRRQGAVDYVVKPPEKKQLLAKIEALLN